MPTQIFVNLPVKDLDRSVAFFTALGFTFNPQFTDKNATCMIISDSIFAMLLVEPFFKTFTPRALCDATTHTEAILALSVESKAKVDEMVGAALAAGGTEPRARTEMGFMYNCAFADPDGHIWEIFWMDPAVVAGQPQNA
ncbi:MAG TPA: hypothetical protein PKZ61_07575 [Thermoflexales bacterium]|nr:hypothetical protein [Thermoflexales bacterium]